MTCRLPPHRDHQLTSVMSLIVSRLRPGDGTYRELAALTVYSHDQLDIMANLTAHVTGHLEDARGDAYISLTWTCPDTEVQGSYRCQAFGMDEKGHPATLTSFVDLQEQSREVGVLDVAEILRNMASKVEDLRDWKLQLGGSGMFLMGNSAMFHGRQYFISRPVVRNVATAASVCAYRNAYLAEVNDQNEAGFLFSFVQREAGDIPVAVGATYVGHTGVWEFLTSGTPVTYFHWGPGQPSRGKGDNCMFLSDKSVMSDGPCVGLDMVRFVCESRS